MDSRAPSTHQLAASITTALTSGSARGRATEFGGNGTNLLFALPALPGRCPPAAFVKGGETEELVHEFVCHAIYAAVWPAVPRARLLADARACEALLDAAVRCIGAEQVQKNRDLRECQGPFAFLLVDFVAGPNFAQLVRRPDSLALLLSESQSGPDVPAGQRPSVAPNTAAASQGTASQPAASQGAGPCGSKQPAHTMQRRGSTGAVAANAASGRGQGAGRGGHAQAPPARGTGRGPAGPGPTASTRTPTGQAPAAGRRATPKATAKASQGPAANTSTASCSPFPEVVTGSGLQSSGASRAAVHLASGGAVDALGEALGRVAFWDAVVTNRDRLLRLEVRGGGADCGLFDAIGLNPGNFMLGCPADKAHPSALAPDAVLTDDPALPHLLGAAAPACLHVYAIDNNFFVAPPEDAEEFAKRVAAVARFVRGEAPPHSQSGDWSAAVGGHFQRQFAMAAANFGPDVEGPVGARLQLAARQFGEAAVRGFSAERSHAASTGAADQVAGAVKQAQAQILALADALQSSQPARGDALRKAVGEAVRHAQFTVAVLRELGGGRS